LLGFNGALLGFAIVIHWRPAGEGSMSKNLRNQRVIVRVAGELRAVLEDEAVTDGRNLSNLVRKILIDHAVARVAEHSNEQVA
jgi:hypothetical protein